MAEAAYLAALLSSPVAHSVNLERGLKARNRVLEHFQKKWEPVFRPKMRQNKELERFPDSASIESALDRMAEFGKLTPAQAEDVKTQPLTLRPLE